MLASNSNLYSRELRDTDNCVSHQNEADRYTITCKRISKLSNYFRGLNQNLRLSEEFSAS